MNLKQEKRLWKKGYKAVVGLDEAGRGPLAGPVVAAAVVLRNSKFKIPNQLKEVKDSKKLTAKKREELYEILIRHSAMESGIGRTGPRVIDRINILEATKLAMKRAVKNLELKTKNIRPDFLILDGNIKLDLPIPQKSIVKADDKIFSCAAASIIAKVSRDRAMARYDKKYPEYGFGKHKGYPTKRHKKMLKKYGPCKTHRKSFRPVKSCLFK